MSKIVVLHSGGLDSSTLLGTFLQTTPPSEILTLSILYGQKHDREVYAAERISEFYHVEHEVFRIPSPVFQVRSEEGTPSSLTDDAEMPHQTYDELSTSVGVSPTYVPFRNGNLISIATSICLAYGGGIVATGVHAEDSRNWAYPDCTPEFIGGMQNAIYVGTYHRVRLVAPFQYMMKSDIVRLGLILKVPYEKTWSCYEGGDSPCGECPTCIERLEAFRVNGATDPVSYRRTNV